MAASDLVDEYRAQGYAVARDLFMADEVAAIAELVERVRADALRHGRSFRHGNLFYNIAQTVAGPVVRMAQWPVWAEPQLDAVRTDPRWAALLAPFIGDDIKQIIHQIHWKPQGAGAGGDFAWHQDSRSRRPREAYRDLANAYVQTGLALDPHTPESGCLQVVPGSHLLGDLGMAADGAVLGRELSDADLAAVGVDPATKRDLLLAPGDVALWSPYLLHASGTNRSGHARRLFINGYVRADACDRGEWAFRGGRPVALPATPSLVHYEALAERPGPHYP
jgi:ectoine hydroxylase-related dioxygenase (phytanoyl-CoA dioxygenase family)